MKHGTFIVTSIAAQKSVNPGIKHCSQSYEDLRIYLFPLQILVNNHENNISNTKFDIYKIA